MTIRQRVLEPRDCIEDKGLTKYRGGAVMALADKTLVCRDCGQEFVFTTGEQEFYQSHGLQNEPSRCPECRSARRRDRWGGYNQRQDRRILQYVLTVEWKPQCRLSPRKGDRSIAKSATLSKKNLVKPYYLVTSYIS